MGNDYIAYPSTIKALAAEIINVCNDYNSRKISNDRISEIIRWYADTQSDKLFAADQLNPTITKIIGKRRVRLINDLLKATEDSGGK